MQVIACRSPEQIRDDSLIEALRICDEALSAFTFGVGYTFTGKRRDNIKAVKARIERVICDGDEWRGSLCPVTHAIYALR